MIINCIVRHNVADGCKAVGIFLNSETHRISIRMTSYSTNL